MAQGSKAPLAGSSPKNHFEAIFQGTGQKLSFTGTSAQSSAVGAGTTIVRVYSDQDVYLEFGSNPTALTTTSMFLPAAKVEYFGITGGHKIAAIRSSQSGTLFITEGASS